VTTIHGGVRERIRATAVGAGLGMAAIVALAGCTPTPPTRGAGATTAAEPTPTASARETSDPAPPPGTTQVEIPAAGISLAIPDGWRQVTGTELADPAVRADLAGTYPGAGSLLEVTDAMGNRATPAFIAVDPSAAETDVPLAANIAVLVSQPSVSGPLLALVAGFVDAGFRDAFGAPTPGRDRVETPLGDAIRIRYELSGGDATPLEAHVWLIGAQAGTLVISVMGAADVVAELDPDALIAESRGLP
jgi:hypothetical protein